MDSLEYSKLNLHVRSIETNMVSADMGMLRLVQVFDYHNNEVSHWLKSFILYIGNLVLFMCLNDAFIS